MKKLSAAWLIDHVAGLRGKKDGHVSSYEKQALVIVTEHGARARDVIAFAKNIRDRVKGKTHISLVPEAHEKLNRYAIFNLA